MVYHEDKIRITTSDSVASEYLDHTHCHNLLQKLEGILNTYFYVFNIP